MCDGGTLLILQLPSALAPGAVSGPVRGVAHYKHIPPPPLQFVVDMY